MSEVDHRAEALKQARQWVDAADREGSIGANKKAESYATVSLAYSNLAIAEGQERVAEELSRINKRLDSITDVSPNTPFGSGKRYLKVKP